MAISKELAKAVDKLTDSLKKKGHTSSEIDEIVSNFKELQERSLDQETAEVEKDIESITEKLEALDEKSIDEKIDARFAELKKSEEKSNVKKVYGFDGKKSLDELESDEKTVTWFSSLIKSTTTRDPEHFGVVKALSEGTDADGGHLVPEEFRMELIEDLRDATVMRRAGAQVWPMARRTLELPKLGSRPQTTWGSENQTVSTTTADFGNLTMTAHKLISRLYTSTELAEDSTPEVTSLIRRLFVTAMSEAEDKAFFTGSGSGRPKGITQETIGSISAGGALNADHLIELLVSTLGQGYRQNAVWVMNSRTWSNVLSLKTDDGAYHRGGEMVVNGPEARILGRPVFEQNDLPSSEIYLFDPSYYYIGDRQRVSVMTSMEADDTFKNDQIQIKVRSRVDGKVALTDAFKKITNTGVS